MDNLILTCKLDTFIDELCEIRREEDIWEYYLHKVTDQSFYDFKNSLILDIQNESTSKQDIEATIKESIEILDNFKLGEVKNGTV